MRDVGGTGESERNGRRSSLSPVLCWLDKGCNSMSSGSVVPDLAVAVADGLGGPVGNELPTDSSWVVEAASPLILLGRIIFRSLSRSSCTDNMRHCSPKMRISKAKSVNLVDGGFCPMKSTMTPPCMYPLVVSPANGNDSKRCARTQTNVGKNTDRTCAWIAGRGIGQSSDLGLRKFCWHHPRRKKRKVEHLESESVMRSLLACLLSETYSM